MIQKENIKSSRNFVQKWRKIHKNKRGYSTEGSTLLPSVLRPRLFGVAGIVVRRTASDYSRKLVKSALMLASIIGLSATVQIINSNSASAFSITLSVPNSVSLNVNPSTNSGFGESSTGSITIKTDSPAGYKLQLGSKSNGTNDLTNGSSKLTSITASTTADNFKNSGAANTWGYKPSKLSGSANSNYVKAPSGSTVDTLDTTSAANGTNNIYTLAIAAKVDNTIPAGTYSNTFVVTSTANTLSYKITYDLNSGTWSGTSPQSGSTTDSSIKLDTHTPTRSNYTFEGWCSTTVTNNSGTNPTCSGTKYSVGDTYTLTGATNNLNLYAMWKSTARSYTITYNNNFTSAGSPSNMPSTQSGSVTSPYNVTLRSNTPTLSGYTFQGWCTSSSITNNGTTSTPSCNGTKYNASSTVTISSNSQTISLYAMWKSRDGESCSHSGWTGTAKLYGGLCWMWTNYGSTYTWANAKTACPSGWHLPSKAEFEKLLNAIGDGSQLSDAGWHDFGTIGVYWSSTEVNSGYAYYLNVSSSYAGLYYNFGKSSDYYVRCVAG